MTRHDPKIDRLRAVSTFRTCSETELRSLAGLLDEALVEPGQVLMREGRHGLEAFFIVEGTAEVTVAGKRVATVGPGETVGEMALLDVAPRSATVTAETPMRIFAADARTFSAVIAKAGIARHILSTLSSRLEAAGTSVAEGGAA